MVEALWGNPRGCHTRGCRYRQATPWGGHWKADSPFSSDNFYSDTLPPELEHKVLFPSFWDIYTASAIVPVINLLLLFSKPTLLCPVIPLSLASWRSALWGAPGCGAHCRRKGRLFPGRCWISDSNSSAARGQKAGGQAAPLPSVWQGSRAHAFPNGAAATAMGVFPACLGPPGRVLLHSSCLPPPSVVPALPSPLKPKDNLLQKSFQAPNEWYYLYSLSSH